MELSMTMGLLKVTYVVYCDSYINMPSWGKWGRKGSSCIILCLCLNLKGVKMTQNRVIWEAGS